MNRGQLVDLAKGAYLYGYPLVYNTNEIISVSTHPNSVNWWTRTEGDTK